MSDSDTSRARLVGINHIALEVGEIDAALEFYGELFEFDLRGRLESKAFLDMGDQFIALSAVDGPAEGRDDHRHFGLVVDDLDAVERRLETLDVELLPTQGLEFRDPWGNRVQVVAYQEIQFTKADHVLRGMGLADLEKSDAAVEELADRGLAPESYTHD